MLVDDEPLIRSALAHTLSVSGLELVGEAGSGEDAIELVLDLRPDVVLMDIKLPDIPGVQAIERLVPLAPASRVVVLARTEDNRRRRRVGFVPKQPGPQADAPRSRSPRGEEDRL